MNLDYRQIRETRAFTCLECGKCTGVCPVSRHSQNFSPRQVLIRSLRNTTPDSLQKEDIWACLTCGYCEEVCPSDIEYTRLTRLVREGVGSENFEGTCSHGGILQSISRLMTSPQLKQNRLEWLTKEFQTSQKSEYMYFVGCLPYFEVLFEEVGAHPLNIARSTMKILNHYGIKPQVLPGEKCCGHDFFWTGDVETFRKLAEGNLEQIKKSGAKKIITACPECYRTLKIEYPALLGPVDYDVLHISEFLSEQFKGKDGGLGKTNQSFTFHDPCRLGRHLGVYDPPRNVLRSIAGEGLREMAHHHRRSICCGVTGWVNCSQVAKQIQAGRLREANSTGAETLVTACAKCLIHFQCALLDESLKNEMNFEIKDFTEVVAENLH